MNKKETEAKSTQAERNGSGASERIRIVAVIFLCILINCAGRQFATVYPIPGWLDTYGTIIASYLYGPFPGALAGAASNVISAIFGIGSAAYSVVSLFLGFAVGVLARKGYFNTIFHTMTVAGASSSGAAILSTIVNLLVAGGNTGNVWGDAVKDYLVEAGLQRNIAVFIGQLYIDFPDKLLASIMMYLMIKVARRIRDKDKKEIAKETVSAAAAVIVFLGCCMPSSDIRASADEHEGGSSYIQTVFSSTNGLLCGHANAIAQTNDGILWIGTYAGLYRYNGSEFLHLSDLSDVRNVNCLYVDREGRLWIGTNDQGVVIVIDGKTTNVIDSSTGLPSDSIRSIVQSASGEYYIGTTGGLVSVELKTGFSVRELFSFAGNVDKLSADSTGRVAALNRENRLFVLDGTDSVKSFDLESEGKEISCCNFSEDDRLFIGTNEGDVYEYVITDKTAEREKRISCADMTKINNIYPDEDGLTWVCSDSGIGFINEQGFFTKQESGEFDNSVENMVCDYQGDLWFASSRLGLLRLTRSCIKDIYTDSGLHGNVVNTTALFGGMLYAGEDTGLTIINMEKHFAVMNELTELLSGTRIRCMVTDSDGLWICSYGAGLIRVEENGSMTSYSEKFPELGTRVRVCCKLNDGSLAVGSSEGLFFFGGGELLGHIPFSDSFGYAQALCLLETPDGTLYAGTDGNGIVKVDHSGPVGRLGRGDGLTSEVILRMVYDDEDGSIYVVTSNSICRLADGKISLLESVPYSNNYDLILDADGEVFVPGSSGIYVFNKSELLSGKKDISSVLLNAKMGLVGSLTANAWNAADGSKNVYFSADRGVFMMNLDDYLLKQPSCRLTVSEVKLDEETVSAERGSDMSVARDVTKIEFVPEIINYTYADPTISYMLEGFDTDWTNVRQSELVSVPYTNLKPGEYTFRLAIRDDRGEILEESTYGFTKEKALYDNKWFRYYMIGVAAVFIGWLTWFITRNQIEHTLELQEAKLARQKTELNMALHQVEMGNQTIVAIAKTVDAKDERTSEHSRRVSEYSMMIAKRYGFTDEECENLRKAALLHDIGKIAIPDSVLNKPARLTDEEYATMKTHVTRGAAILKDFTMIDHVVEGAKFHHERYDGRGYPDGLKGEDIPLYGRIIAIADAFDAMTANRVYRQKQDFDYVLSELHKGRGTQFDPELLDIFLSLIDDKEIDIDKLYAAKDQSADDDDKDKTEKKDERKE